MKRDVHLLTYLPPFMQEYKEIPMTLNAEDPEFILVWNAADRVLNNTFIQTADELGLSRFESILKISPNKSDTLESRRLRIQARWWANLPYTLRMFLERLKELCGDRGFTMTKEFYIYRINLGVTLDQFGEVEELDRLIRTMLPCNMVIVSLNTIPCKPQTTAYAAGGICCVEHFTIST